MQTARNVAWLAMAATTAFLVHAEVLRPEIPDGVRVYTDVVYRRVGSRRPKLDIYVPTDQAAPPEGRPVILAIHGGGWRGGTKNGYGRDIAKLAKYGYIIVSVDYVLSRPGRPTWPENLNDVREAVRWVRRHAEDYGIDPNRIAALGASAGGHLAALLGTNAMGADPEARVQAIVDFYGPTDLAALVKSPGAVIPLKLYLGQTPTEAPELYASASPLTYISDDDAPALIFHGEADDLVPVAQSVELANGLKAVGVPADVFIIKEAGHSFGFEVEGKDLLPEIVAFLERSWKRAKPGER